MNVTEGHFGFVYFEDFVVLVLILLLLQDEIFLDLKKDIVIFLNDLVEFVIKLLSDKVAKKWGNFIDDLVQIALFNVFEAWRQHFFRLMFFFFDLWMYFECRALGYLASDLLDEGIVLEQRLLDLL